MPKGNIEKANALSAQISKNITRQNKTRLSKLNSKTRPKTLWSVVRRLTSAKRDTAHVDGITADSLNTTTPVSPLTHNTRNLHTNLPVLLLLTSLFQNSFVTDADGKESYCIQTGLAFLNNIMSIKLRSSCCEKFEAVG